MTTTRRTSKVTSTLSRALQRAGLPNATTLASLLLVTPGFVLKDRDVLQITSKTAFAAALNGAGGNKKIGVTELHDHLIAGGFVERINFDSAAPSERWIVAITNKLHDYRVDYM